MLRTVSGAAVLTAALLLAAAPAERPRRIGGSLSTRVSAYADTTRRDTTRRDTRAQSIRPISADSAAVPRRPNSLAAGADTLASDTLASDTLRLVPRYAPERPRRRGSALFPGAPVGGRTAGLTPERSSFWAPRLGSRYQHSLALDSTGQAIIARERVGEEEVAAPLRVGRDVYRRARREEDLRANWLTLRREHQRQRQQDDGRLGVSIDVPGGRESAFTTIFGKNEVSLDINGQADVNAGFDYRRSDQQAALTGSPTQLNPDFKQDLRLGITGSIGDKMQVDVNWDTQSQFDYQNQLKLQYTGYEDDIIQSVEAGNVFLDTPSRLIDGGQSLFGIKSELRLGGLRLTTVASQQEGQSQSLSIEGGSETTEFDFSALEYDERRHFFLAYYFRNTWETAHSEPPTLVSTNGFDRITELQVWKLQSSKNYEGDRKDVIAMVDLGEPAELVEQANDYTDDLLPDPSLDQYDEAFLSRLRSEGGNSLNAELDEKGLSKDDYQKGEQLKLLQEGQDYTFDDDLGYISLRQRLHEDEALAVAFRYRAQDGVHKVGDFSNEVGDNRLVLKLLRPSRLESPSGEGGPAAWYLQMRNIYELRGSNFDESGFELELEYHPPGGTAQTSLPELGGQQSLLQMLGLDRIDADGSNRPDGEFDFQPGYTIDTQKGVLLFPYLQPFGAHLREEIVREAPGGDQQALIDQYVFSRLYTEKPDALQNTSTETDRYRIAGSSKGGAPDFYDLRAFNGLVEGSVSVTSGGTELTEGVDYQVDYQGGTVTITDPSYLSAGRDIEIDYEKNALVNLQKKTLLGARADYSFRENLTVGATLMRLSQRSPADKLRIGQEPIKNTIWGVDAALQLEPRWLTRAVDALPFIQTKAPSALDVSAEFAQLRPGHTQTQAFERTRRRLQDAGRDFASDELEGISYIDDFEGFENSFSLKSQLQSWRIAAAPADYEPPTGPSAGAGVAQATNNWRGTLAWYQLNNNILEQLSEARSYDEELTQLIEVNSVFPNRDTRGQTDNTLRTLDFYFDPQRRGPYNYTDDLRGFLARPQGAWGGITQALPEGQTDFGVKNIEFVEFVFKPYPKDAATADSAALYLDLGTISEDVIPNGEPNREDGLSLSSFDDLYRSPSYRSSRAPVTAGNGIVDIEGDLTEDLGLDGLASYDPGLYNGSAEQDVFGDFLNALPGGGSARLRAEVARARRDPSGDDYHFYDDSDFFEDETLFPGGASLQERFAFYYSGLELNSYQTQNTLPTYASGRGNTREPDAEDFGSDGVNSNDSYFQYRVPLNEDILKNLARPSTTDDFIVGEIQTEDGQGTGWYQARIPVRAPTDSVGTPNLSTVEKMRLWTTGHRGPITLRFATLELVGTQWRKSESVTLSEGTSDTPDPDRTEPGGSRLTIASINNEEDSGIYQRPRRAVIGQQRLATGGRQNTREQSLVLRMENLLKGDRRAIYKNIQSLDLLKYSGLRMFAHLHSTAGDFEGLTEEKARKQIELFVRLGANETNDYYEYRQPLTPTLGDLTTATPEELWFPLDATEPGLANEMNLRLTALNQLKVARDRSNAQPNEVFWSDANDVTLNPALGAFAPQGARIGVKGTPSLQNVSTIVIGLRARDSEQVDNAFEDLTLWVNELRATGYDEKSGWKAVASADVQLADFANVQASFQRQTDGWGSLASTLDERQQNRLLNWNVRADFSLDKLLPATGGWQIPVTLQFGSRTSTPRYAPNRGDVRLDAILDQASADADAGLSRTAALRAAQTYSAERTVTVGLQKSGSQSPWLRYTLDNLNFSYSLFQANAHNPSSQIDDNWNWSADLDYRFDVERPHTVRPFWFLEELPLVGGLGGLRFNYAPQSVGFYGSLARNGSRSQDRPTRLLASADGTTTDGTTTGSASAGGGLAEGNAGGGGGLREPIRDQHSFDHDREFNLQYNPFEFLRLTFDTRTTQSLNQIGAREQFRVVGGAGEEMVFENRGRAEIGLANATRRANVENAFIEERLDMIGAGGALQRLFGGGGPRTNRYNQRFSAALDVPFGDSEAFNWIDVEDVAYEVNYRWNNGPLGRQSGANVSNEVSIRSGLVFHPQALWRKFGFYRRLEEQQEAAGQAAGGRRERERGNEPSSEGSGAAGEEGSGDGDGEEEGEGVLSNLPLPNPVGLLRRVALGLTGMRDFSIEYEATREAQSSHVGISADEGESSGGGSSGGHTLIDALQGEAPPLGYRFGLSRRITDLRLTGGRYSLDDRLSDGNRLRARTTLRFSQNLQVNLNWSMNWQERSTYSNIGHPEEGQTLTRDGSNTSSVWAFGGSYRAFFERQLATLQDDAAAGYENADADGRVVLTNASMSSDFRRAFALTPGTAGQGSLLALPMPSWTVTYSGLSDWPLVRSLTQSVNLTHGYTAEYASSFRSINDETSTFLQLNQERIEYTRASYNSQRQSVQERFQPLIGLDVSWKGAFQTDLEWNRTQAFSLQPASQKVVEDRTNELRLTASYRKQGLEIPFLPFGDLNNQITFSLTASRSMNNRRDFRLRDAIGEAASLEGGPGSYDPARALQNENVTVNDASTRLQIAPKISYRFSNRISADFVMRYEHFKGNRRPSYDNIDGGFNVRVSLQE